MFFFIVNYATSLENGLDINRCFFAKGTAVQEIYACAHLFPVPLTFKAHTFVSEKKQFH